MKIFRVDENGDILFSDRSAEEEPKMDISGVEKNMNSAKIVLADQQKRVQMKADHEKKVARDKEQQKKELEKKEAAKKRTQKQERKGRS